MQVSGHEQQPDQAVSRAWALGRAASSLFQAAAERSFIKYTWRAHCYCARGLCALKASCPHKLFNFPGCRPGACSHCRAPLATPSSTCLPPPRALLTPSEVCKAGERPHRSPFVRAAGPELILNHRGLVLELGGPSALGTIKPELRCRAWAGPHCVQGGADSEESWAGPGPGPRPSLRLSGSHSQDC